VLFSGLTFFCLEPEDFLDEPARTVVEAQLPDRHVVFLAVSANFGPEVDFNFGNF
jgi:hypothetical protein